MGVERIGISADASDSAALRSFDKNNDGSVSAYEVRQYMAKFVDENKDKTITKEEAGRFLDKLGVKNPQLREELTHTLTTWNYEANAGQVGFGHDLATCKFEKEAVCVNFVDDDEKK